MTQRTLAQIAQDVIAKKQDIIGKLGIVKVIWLDPDDPIVQSAVKELAREGIVENCGINGYGELTVKPLHRGGWKQEVDRLSVCIWKNKQQGEELRKHLSDTLMKQHGIVKGVTRVKADPEAYDYTGTGLADRMYIMDGKTYLMFISDNGCGVSVRDWEIVE